MIGTADDTPAHKSPISLSLSPLSSRFAAEAERANIRRLRQECRGLSAALKLLKKSSKEWVMIKSKLDIAREELECVLEDRSMFQSFTGVKDAAGGINVDDCISLIATPPLASASGKEANGSNGGKSQKVNVHESLSSIPSLPLASPADGSSNVSSRNQTDRPNMDQPINSPERKEYPEIYPKDQKTVQESDKPEKYSLEWFENKASKPVPLVSSSSAPHSPDDMRTSKKLTSLRPRTSPPAEYKPKIIIAPEQKGGTSIVDVKDLSAQLEKVPKYSIEWFTIKKAMKSGEEVINNDHSHKTNADDAFREKIRRNESVHENNSGEGINSKLMNSQTRRRQQQQRLDMVLERSKTLLDNKVQPGKQQKNQPQPSTSKSVYDSTSKRSQTPKCDPPKDSIISGESSNGKQSVRAKQKSEKHKKDRPQSMNKSTGDRNVPQKHNDINFIKKVHSRRPQIHEVGGPDRRGF